MNYGDVNLMEVGDAEKDLHHKELLELDPKGCVIRYAGQRALLVGPLPCADIPPSANLAPLAALPDLDLLDAGC